MEELADAPGQLDLGAAGEALLGERTEDGVGDPRGLAQQLELARLLHRAQPLDEPGPGDGLDAAALQRLQRGHRHHVRLDPDRPSGEPRREVADDGAGRPLEPHALDRARPARVAEVREERGLAVGLHEHGSVRARKPGQIEDVDAARDEQRLLEQRGESLEPAHLRIRNSRASR